MFFCQNIYIEEQSIENNIQVKEFHNNTGLQKF